MEATHDFNTVGELLDALAPYISARSLARICDINESQMLQYKAGLKQISPRTVARINEKLRNFCSRTQRHVAEGRVSVVPYFKNGMTN